MTPRIPPAATVAALALALPAACAAPAHAAQPTGAGTGGSHAVSAPLGDAPTVAVGADSLLAREAARMRDALATAALGGDHELLVARKRSTDWAFLATALTVAVAAGERTPSGLVGSIADCDAASHRTDASHARGAWLLDRACARRRSRTADGPRPADAAEPSGRPPLHADAITFSSTGAGSDFPCAIRWRITVGARGVVARAIWHEPMLALRAVDAPLAPDRTVIEVDSTLVQVRCWGYGMRADPWPTSPAPLDQLGDGYDLADAARHWWWSRAPQLPSTPGACGIDLALPECDAIRHSPWRVIAQHAMGTLPPHAAQATAERASISVPVRAVPATLSIDDHGNRIMLREQSGDGCLRVLQWRMGDETIAGPWPTPEWREAQSRIAAAQGGGGNSTVPYAIDDITGSHVPESHAHARAAAHVWHMAYAGDGSRLVEALAAAESLRRARGLPWSVDAMALASLAESLAERNAPDWAVATAVARHALAALSLPIDAAAARSAWRDAEIAPSLDQLSYRRMLLAGGRAWAAAPLATGTEPHEVPGAAATDGTDPVTARFNAQWIARAAPTAGERWIM